MKLYPHSEDGTEAVIEFTDGTAMQQRNAAAADLNTVAFVQQQRSANNVSAVSEGNTWQTYIP